jgi:hypothetical protein
MDAIQAFYLTMQDGATLTQTSSDIHPLPHACTLPGDRPVSTWFAAILDTSNF